MPSHIRELSGVADAEWQNRTARPQFEWSGAHGGAGAAVGSYEIYWGDDANGEAPTETTAMEHYSPAGPPDPQPEHIVNYLRMRVHDTAENVSDWGTMFAFKYDSAVPSAALAETADYYSTSLVSLEYDGSDAEGGSGLAGALLWYDHEEKGWLQFGALHETSPIRFDAVKAAGDGRYDVYVLAQDIAGNTQPLEEAVTRRFKIDTVPPHRSRRLRPWRRMQLTLGLIIHCQSADGGITVSMNKGRAKTPFLGRLRRLYKEHIPKMA